MYLFVYYYYTSSKLKVVCVSSEVLDSVFLNWFNSNHRNLRLYCKRMYISVDDDVNLTDFIKHFEDYKDNTWYWGD